jgi:putative ABC transport system permease protein
VAVRAKPVIVEGRMFTPGTDEIVVGTGISTRFEHCRVGDALHVQKRMLKVVGRFATGGSAYESEIWGDGLTLMPLFHREGVYAVGLMKLKNPARYLAVKQELEHDPRLNVAVKREDLFYAEQSQGVTIMVTVLGMFITVIMAVGALFGAANTMFAAVSGRTREIATLLVLGFSPFAVMLSFVFESMLIALVGGVLGCIIALPINGITTSTTNFQSFSEVTFQFRVTPQLMVAALVFAAALGVLGGFFPALRAARQPIASTLRGG